MTTTPIAADEGKAAALVVYVLYLLSIPSVGTLALAGFVVALICQSGADGVWRAHLESQARVWVTWLMWAIGLFVAGLAGWLLTIVLIGFPILWIVCLGYFVLMLWFTVKSVFGLVALLENRAP